MKSLLAGIQSLKNSKTILSLALSFFLLVSVTRGQSADAPKMHFGMKIQPALAWLRSDTKGLESNGSEFRFTYGFISEFKFAERYYFATGVDVSNRGGSTRITYSDTAMSVVSDANWKLRYIEIPLTLKLKTNEIGYLSYYLQFGLAPGFNIRSVADVTTTTQLTGGGTQTASDEKVDVSDDVNFFNLSLVIGLGAEYRFSGTTSLVGGITFSNGFLDAASSNDVKLNTNYLGLTVGILF